jgi:two-component system phosphate regulon response regulator PhoB
MSSVRSKQRILVVEDDDAIAEILMHNLTREGYEVECKEDGLEALNAALAHPPDLVVLDLMLPGMDGVEICRRLRRETRTKGKPILMLTAKSDEVDQIVGFTVGADDYVTKPFSVKVLLERVRVLLARRAHQQEDTQQVLSGHGVTVDRMAHEAHVGGRRLPLTPTEFRLLETLMVNPGRAFSRADLLSAAVGTETIVLERTIDVHIRSLRSKLGELGSVIETVRGVGYRFSRNPSGNRSADSDESS